MSGTSTTAPSPAPVDYLMDTMEETGPFSHGAVNNMNSMNSMDSMNGMSGMSGIWGPPLTQASLTDLPEIRVFSSVPEINISGPDEASFMRPNQIPIATQSQVNVHYPNSSETFPDESQPQTNTVFDNRFDSGDGIAPPMNIWNNSDPFAVDATVNISSFPEFDFNSDPAISFTQMMDLNTSNPEPRKVTSGSHLDAFNNGDLELTETIPTPTTPEDVEPSYVDPTHADVHALMQEHYTTTLKMLRMCLKSCEHATGDKDSVKTMMLKNMQLLEKGIEAFNKETDRKVKNTLKDIASTQRRATQSIRDLSYGRKRKIEQLHSEIGQLQAQVQALTTTNTTFGYG